MNPPTTCAKFSISFVNDLVHHSRISSLACLVMHKYSIYLSVYASMIASAYPGSVFCAVV